MLLNHVGINQSQPVDSKPHLTVKDFVKKKIGRPKKIWRIKDDGKEIVFENHLQGVHFMMEVHRRSDPYSYSKYLKWARKMGQVK